LHEVNEVIIIIFVRWHIGMGVRFEDIDHYIDAGGVRFEGFIGDDFNFK
jgi:hypothetical protein